MSKDLFNRYIWIVDTIRRYGKITREELNARWKRSPFSNGEPLARRTFYSYRMAIEELFQITIECNNSTFEYSINQDDAQCESMTNWLLNTTAMNNILSGSRDVANRIFIEDVPSARQYLAVVIDALKEFHPLRFTYQPFSRSTATPNVVIEPYFLKFFKQRWYITGRNVKENTIKTYALDRMHDVTLESDTFTMPEHFDAEAYFRDSFGIMFSHGEAKHIMIKTTNQQAKYFRALPLHHSQHEMIHDTYSVFSYKLRITNDFVQELLSYGPAVQVIEPPELRAIITKNLEEALSLYKKAPTEQPKSNTDVS